MLRLLTGLFLLASCSLGIQKSGGERSYLYRPSEDYSLNELNELASSVVSIQKRDPQQAKLDDLFNPSQAPLKKIGILVFETILQPTRGGLADADKVYLSEQGKQLLTERMLSIWEQAFPVLAAEIIYIPTSKLKKTRSFTMTGGEVEDFIKTRRTSIGPDDIYYAPKGARTTTATVMNPRGMRDLSLLLVPATELMGGPKWSEHQKHLLNDVAKELGLDAVLIVMTEVSWSASRLDKHSGVHLNEELKFKISASTLIPLSSFNARLEKLKDKSPANLTLCYRSYETDFTQPVQLSVDPKEETFFNLEKHLLNPMFKTYRDLVLMNILAINKDLKATH
jgi:hypothetical protein